MKALLLAAGMGTRLAPITDTIPKCLVPIHGIPLLQLWCELLFRADMERIVINTHYKADQVHAFIAASPWADRVDLLYEEALLGTGGTIRNASHLLGGSPALIAHADNLSSLDVRSFQEAHASRPAAARMTMALFPTDVPQSCGIVECDKHGMITAFHEKVADPPGNLANAAIYIMEQDLITEIASIKQRFVDLSIDVIPRLLGQIHSYPMRGYHRDIGTPDALAKAHQEVDPAAVDSFLNGGYSPR